MAIINQTPMKTTNERFDELCGDWEEKGRKYRSTPTYNILKIFIQQEKSLLLDQAIEEGNKLRDDTWHLADNPPEVREVWRLGYDAALSQAISKLEELKT